MWSYDDLNYTSLWAADTHSGLPCVPCHCLAGNSVWGILGQWKVFLDLGALGPEQPQVKVCRTITHLKSFVEAYHLEASMEHKGTWMPGGML